ncbi:MAG: hypothetical protein ACOYI9_03085 [Candidatus Hydrogenedentales bacterium]|jgi:ribosomal protein L40E
MAMEPFEPLEYKEGIEADAVCSQCGSTNPEGTLLCKTCGNNLRDQRHLRLTADQMLNTEKELSSRSMLLTTALPVLGLLILLWLGLNAGRISSLLTTPDYGRSQDFRVSAQSFWQGPESDNYDQMLQSLMSSFPSFSDAETVRMEPLSGRGWSDGVYALYERHGTQQRFVGAALLQTEGDAKYFVAQINNDVEMRGKLIVQEQALLADWNNGAFLYDGEYYPCYGSATFNADGTVHISGGSTYNSITHQSIAYRVSSF